MVGSVWWWCLVVVFGGSVWWWCLVVVFGGKSYWHTNFSYPQSFIAIGDLWALVEWP